jgi:Leu/Phe-tRNA-protein transferase
MFHRVSDASEVALFHLSQHLRRREFMVSGIDAITSQLGGITIARDEYLKRLGKAVERPCLF